MRQARRLCDRYKCHTLADMCDDSTQTTDSKYRKQVKCIQHHRCRTLNRCWGIITFVVMVFITFAVVMYFSPYFLGLFGLTPSSCSFLTPLVGFSVNPKLVCVADVSCIRFKYYALTKVDPGTQFVVCGIAQAISGELAPDTDIASTACRHHKNNRHSCSTPMAQIGRSVRETNPGGATPTKPPRSPKRPGSERRGIPSIRKGIIEVVPA